MGIEESVLDSDLDGDQARSYRNGFSAALIAAFMVLSYQYWVVGELAVGTMGILFATAFVFILSRFIYTRGQ